jgi:hypothetical protein
MDNYSTIYNEVSEIKQKLLDAGISEADAIKVLKDLDQAIFSFMTHDVIQNLAPSELKEITQSPNDDASIAKKISELLGISEEQIATYYSERLQEYLAKLPENLPHIKEQLEQQKTNSSPIPAKVENPIAN